MICKRCKLESNHYAQHGPLAACIAALEQAIAVVRAHPFAVSRDPWLLSELRTRLDRLHSYSTLAIP